MIGPKTYQLLRTMGLSTIDALGAVPPELMERVMGKNGLVIWQKANGIDPTPVRQYSEQDSLSSETTFETDTIDVVHLNELLSAMTEKLAWRLRRRTKLTACVSVKIRYANFDTHTLQQRIPYTAFDHMLIPVVHDLFRRLYQRRLLIRLIGVRFSQMVGGAQQIDLFEDTPEMTSLYMAIDKVRQKYGGSAVHKAVVFSAYGNEERSD